jgi:hypothetical protein
MPSLCTENKGGVDCSFNAALHVEVDPARRCLSRLSFSLLRIVEPEGGIPFVADAFDLCAEGTLDPALALRYANHFAGADRYDAVQREYPLYQRNDVRARITPQRPCRTNSIVPMETNGPRRKSAPAAML